MSKFPIVTAGQFAHFPLLEIRTRAHCNFRCN